MQKEITEKCPLLDANGDLACPGFAKKLYPVYNKKTDFKSRFKTKEWDYYYVGNSHFGLALTIDDNGYMGMDSISFLNFDKPWEVTKSEMQIMTLGKKNLPPTSTKGDIKVQTTKYAMSFINNGDTRVLSGFMNNFLADAPIMFEVTLSEIPEESMVIMTPFEKQGHFYYNQKIICMRADGYVSIGGTRYEFNGKDSFATLDWGRGIWTYENTWYWSSLNTEIDGEAFGFNLGYGFGDTSAASENMLFYKGKAHKLDRVTFNIPKTEKGKDDFLSEWTFTSNDNRVNLTFTPVINRRSCTNVLVILSDQNQVFGKFNGTCVLDDGTVITLKDVLGFAEKVHNKW